MTILTTYMPGLLTADFGVWIFLAIMVVTIGLAVRSISRANMSRLERGGAGGETVQDRKRKKDERAARKAKEKGGRAAPSDDEDGPKRRGPKPKKGQRGRKGKGAPSQRRQPPPEPDDDDEEAAEEPAPEAPPEPKGPDLLLPEGKSLGEGLSKTREQGFVGRIGKLFKGRQVDEALLDQIEEVLFTADIGVKTSTKLLEGMRAKLSRKELADASRIWSHLRQEAVTILEGAGKPNSLQIAAGATEPHVVLVIGVNGSGKTTSIGKLAHRLVADGKKVLVGAGDTFRAAAGEQLEIWAKRVGASFVDGKDGADPSSVLFDAVKQGKEEGVDVILLDTAGRLHTNANLVKELKKVNRTIDKALPGAPHEVLLVLDGTQGQNAIAQAHTFGEALGVTGFVLTKLDGTAKGGVILGICDELKLPLCWIGIGERTEDLRPFDGAEFVEALFEGADAA